MNRKVAVRRPERRARPTPSAPRIPARSASASSGPGRVDEALVRAQERRQGGIGNAVVVAVGTQDLRRLRLAEHRIVLLELPARDGQVARAAAVGRREPVDEVLEHRLGVVERLVEEDAAREVAAHLRPALARLELHVVQRRDLVVPHVLVDRRALRRRRVLAQHALPVGHVEPVAVGELRDARVQELPSVAVQPVVAVDRLVPGGVREHGHDERDGERRGARPVRAQEERASAARGRARGSRSPV